jgi:hypothetical protein
MTPHRIATALIAPTLVFRRCACGAAITVTRSCSGVRDTVRRDITIAWRLHCTAKPPANEEGVMRVDFELSGGGTVYLLRPVTRAAHSWVEDHLPADATWFGGAVVSRTDTSGRSSAGPSATGWWCSERVVAVLSGGDRPATRRHADGRPVPGRTAW